MLSERSPIDAATPQLRRVPAQALAGHQGLALEADEGTYIKRPWVRVHIQCYLDVFA